METANVHTLKTNANMIYHGLWENDPTLLGLGWDAVGWR